MAVKVFSERFLDRFYPPVDRVDPDARLTGFRIGEDLQTVPSARRALLFGPLHDYVEAQAIAYNAAVCRRGLDRWQDDGGP